MSRREKAVAGRAGSGTGGGRGGSYRKVRLINGEKEPEEEEWTETSTHTMLGARKDSFSSAENTFMDRSEEPLHGVWSFLMMMMAWILVFFTFPFSLFICLKVAKEYERVVIFRIGRLLEGSPRGPGVFLILPCVDHYRKVDLREVSFDVPPQEVLSKDSVTVTVDAVIFFHISNPVVSTINVTDAHHSTKLLAQTTLRNILGTKTLTEMLAQRDSISATIQKILDDGTDPWGVKVDRVEVKDVRLPHQLLRVMAAEAEAARDARAKVIAAEGEREASRALKEASDVIQQSPVAMQLRYLQTLSTIASEHSSTIVFPIPMDFMRALGGGNCNPTPPV